MQWIIEMVHADKTTSSGTTRFRLWFLYFLIAETIIINLVTCITIYTQCEKVETIWDPVGTPSKCWPGAVQAVSHAFHLTHSLTHWHANRISVSSKEVYTYLLTARGTIMADFKLAANSLTDLILTVLPITIFFKLQMQLRLKIGLAALLSLSIL